MELYEKVRRACLREEMSQRQAAEKFGISRWTVRKMLTHHKPPGYQRVKKIHRPILADYEAIIEKILEEDKAAPRKQRHTLQRLYNRLVTEHGFMGSYSSVRRYAKGRREEKREVYLPLTQPLGGASYDFEEAWVNLGGEQVRIHYAVICLNRSDRIFTKAYIKENTQAFVESHISGFEFFQGVPCEILYDNTTLAVKLKKGCRAETTAFTELKSFYLFESHFCAPGKGNEKGKVENKVGYIRRHFLTPLPEFKDLAALNSYLKECCKAFNSQKDALKTKEEKQALLALPEERYSATHSTYRRVTKMSLVRYDYNDYSVPTSYAYKEVLIQADYDQIKISFKASLIACHNRCYDKDQQILKPEHYLTLIHHKIRSVRQAAALEQLPPCYRDYLQRLSMVHGKKGERNFIEVLKLLEGYSLDELTRAIKKALKTGSDDYHTVKQILLNSYVNGQNLKKPFSTLSLPQVSVLDPNLNQYDQLRR